MSMPEPITDMTVAEWLQLHPQQMVVVDGDTPISGVIKNLLSADAQDAYVVKDNCVLGHLSFKKMVNHLFSHERPVHSHRQIFARVIQPTAAELMDPHFVYCRESETVNQILHRQLQCEVTDLVVLGTNNAPIGVIKLTDVVRESLK